MIIRWTPDGTHLLFLSNRSGDPALWSMPLRERGDGTPTVVKNGIGRVILHGVLSSGTLVYEEMGLDPLIVAEFVQPVGPNGAPSLRTLETLNGQAPAWSPDGRYLAYKRRTTNPGRPFEMVVRTSDSGELRTYSPVAGAMGDGRPTWYNDGTVQAIWRSGIRLKTAGSALEEVEVPRTLPMGYVSPDGHTLYATGNNGGVDTFDVTSGTRTGSISLPEGWRFAALSPNGQSLALVSFANDKAPTRLGLIGIDGTGFRQLQTSVLGPGVQTVSWTRDSTALLVEVQTRKNVSSIQRVALDGGAPVTIASDLGELLSFAISPDGRRIAYSINRPTTDVWMLELKAASK
jgi:Tol biopolymer transport system component